MTIHEPPMLAGAILLHVLLAIHRSPPADDAPVSEARLVENVVRCASELAILGIIDGRGIAVREGQTKKGAVIEWYVNLPE